MNIVDAPKTGTFQMRINPEVKKQVESLYAKCGMTLTDAVNAFFQQSLNVGGLPFLMNQNSEEVMRQQVINEGKPAAIADKIVMGKINKYYKENCLVDQEFVKDSKLTVAQYTKNTAKELGGSIEIKKFVRFEKGDGIEKRQDDFAAEVASMVK